MSQKQPQLEDQDGKDEESDVTRDGKTSPMGKFKSLAQGLLKVTREQLDEEQKRYASSRSGGQRRDRLKSP